MSTLAQAILLFEFTDATQSYRYTSDGADFAHSDGNTYSSVTIEADTVEVGGDDQPVMVISCAVTVGVVQDHAFGDGPRDLELTITMVDVNDSSSQQVWSGPVTSFQVEGDEAKLRVANALADALQTSMPSISYQPQCNHRLYDSRCGIARGAIIDGNSLQVNTTVSSQSGTSITVTSDGGNADGFFAGGEMVRVSDGERRTIQKHVGDVVTIEWPFPTLNDGDSIELHAGCDRTITTCNNKFENAIRFGGHPYIPQKNPFDPFGIKGQT